MSDVDLEAIFSRPLPDFVWERKGVPKPFQRIVDVRLPPIVAEGTREAMEAAERLLFGYEGAGNISGFTGHGCKLRGPMVIEVDVEVDECNISGFAGHSCTLRGPMVIDVEVDE